MDMNSNNFKMRFASLILLSFLLGCGGNVVLDNPREEEVVFEFDGSERYELASNGQEEISLDPGQHSVRVLDNAGEVLGDTTFNLKEEGIVHSGAATYVVWRQLYGLQSERETLLNEKWVEFDSIKTYGDFKIYRPEWLYVEKNWDYGLDEDLPDSRSLYINKDFLIESKVFRSKDFISKYKEMQAK